MNDEHLTNGFSLKDSRAIGILGMHRSGTSAVSRVINLLGVYLGESSELYGKRTDNPEGFWERKDIVQLHDQILTTIHQRWDSPIPLQQDLKSYDIADVQQKLKKVVVNAFAGRPLWAWKDPRTCLLFPFWQEILFELGVTLSIVYVIRNPLDVAKSLAKRDNFSVAKSLGIWLNYNLSALKLLKEHSFVIVSYDHLLDDPSHQIKRLAQHISEDSHVDISKIIDFLRLDLRHTQSTIADLHSAPELVAGLYNHIISVAEGRMIADQSFFEKVVAMDLQYRKLAEFFRWDMENYFFSESSEMPQLRNSLENSKHKNEEYCRHIADLSLKFEKKEQSLVERDQRINVIQQKVEKYEQQLAEHRENMINFEDQKVILLSTIRDLEQTSNKTCTQIAKQKKYINTLERRCNYMLNSKSWRITKPLRAIRRFFLK